MNVEKTAVSSHFVDKLVDKLPFLSEASLKRLWILWITFPVGVDKD